MDLKRDKQVFFCLVLFAGIGGVLSGFCTEEYECRKTCTVTIPILRIFGIHISIPWSCKATCTREACCTGYTGTDCSQRTDDCQQNGRCSGHKCVEQFTEDCWCMAEETMTQKFMGSNKRTVRVPCEQPCERTKCCDGFKGEDCNERYDSLSSEGDNTFLTAGELESLKEQLKIDEGYRDEIYNDTEGYLTFGIGHLIRKTDEEYGKPIGTKVKDERIQELFKADVHIAVQEVLTVFPSANTFPGEVKEILVNMMFNLGSPKLKKFVNFIAAVNDRNWSKAAVEMVNSKWYTQVKNRSKRLVARMRAVASATGN